VKKRLFTPGPTPIPESVLLKMSEPIIHHRNPEFQEILTRMHDNLKYLFQTDHPVVALTCSGTGGVEATFVSLFSPGDTIISVNNGKFGERWVRMPRTFGLEVEEIAIPWGSAPTVEQILDALKRRPEAKAVYLTQSETSTGTATDVKAIAAAVNEEYDALVCVDGISAVGAMELRFDEWGIDVCITGSQKGLMVPPGLAFVAVSARAIAAMERSTMPRFYLDLGRALKSYKANDTPWTPAITLLIGVDVSLRLIREEGLEKVWERHTRLSNAVRAGVSGMGLRLFSQNPSNAVTAVWMPEGIDWKAFNRVLKHDHGITIAGGQDSFAGKLFRISHLGYYDDLDVIAVISAIEKSFVACGYQFEVGSGLSSAQALLV